MPESKGRAKAKKASAAAAQSNQGRKAASMTNPSWFVPVMVGLLIVGLIWIVAFYITQGSWPIGAWGYWNLAIGFVLLISGFMMTTRWR